MRQKYFVLLFLIICSSGFAQELTNPTIKFGGFVNWTAIYDSRQVVAAREAHFLLYPKPEELNTAGKDINDFANTQLTVIQTRLSANITGLKFLGAATNSLVEAEFMGNSDNDVNGFRIRHAFLNLKWESLSLLLGQYWIPFFNTDMFPEQIGSNAGAPFQPFGRAPQVRLTYQTENTKTIFALLSQRDYTSTGPNGSSGEYLRNSTLPALQLQFQYNIGKSLAGIGVEAKRLKPGAKSPLGFCSEEYVNSFALTGFSKFSINSFTVKASGVYGSNMTDYTMLGGYAISETDVVNKTISYTPIKIYSIWGDISYGNDLQFALFAGYTKNLGADNIITGAYYSRGNNVASIFRIAPRIQYREGNIKWSFEVENTTAAYGTPDSYGVVNSINNISNLRVHTSVFYYISI